MSLTLIFTFCAAVHESLLRIVSKRARQTLCTISNRYISSIVSGCGVFQVARMVLLYLSMFLFLLLASGLLFRYLSYRSSKKQTVKIDSQTCTWVQDPPVWKHKTNGLYYCPHCAPNPSPLSSDWYCPKCERGFGKGEVFTVPDAYD